MKEWQVVFSPRYIARMQQRLEFRQGAEWNRDSIRILVRDERLTPDVAERWHRRRFQLEFVEPSRFGEVALQKDTWPLTLATLYIANGGDLTAVAREFVRFNDWDRGLWLASKKSEQVMSLAKADKAIWTALRTDKLSLLYPHGSGMKRIDRLALLKLQQINPWRAHRLSYDGVNVARDADGVPFSQVEVEAVEVRKRWPAQLQPEPERDSTSQKRAKPGPKPDRMQRVKDQMLDALRRGEKLKHEKQEVLASRFGASRGTCTKALDQALSEFGTPTNSDTK